MKLLKLPQAKINYENLIKGEEYICTVYQAFKVYKLELSFQDMILKVNKMKNNRELTNIMIMKK